MPRIIIDFDQILYIFFNFHNFFSLFFIKTSSNIYTFLVFSHKKYVFLSISYLFKKHFTYDKMRTKLRNIDFFTPIIYF